MEEKIITIDLTGCKYLGELHERIRIAFDFPEWYGQNWSAFHDLLRGECDADIIKIIGLNTLSSDFDEHIKIMKEVILYEQEKRKNSEEELTVIYIDG